MAMMELFNGPGFLSARSTMGSDVSYLFAVTFTTLYLIAGFLALRHRGREHHRMILFSVLAMLAYFTFYYLVRRLGLTSLEDEINFPGPPWVYQKIFRPTLFLHFLIVSLSTFLSLYMLGNGLRTAITRNERMALRNDKVRVSRILWGIGFAWLAFLLWWVSSVSLFSLWHKGMILTLGYFIPVGVVLIIRKTLPYSEKRHRVLGRICITSFVGLLLTSTLVYYLLYLAY